MKEKAFSPPTDLAGLTLVKQLAASLDLYARSMFYNLSVRRSQTENNYYSELFGLKSFVQSAVFLIFSSVTSLLMDLPQLEENKANKYFPSTENEVRSSIFRRTLRFELEVFPRFSSKRVHLICFEQPFFVVFFLPLSS